MTDRNDDVRRSTLRHFLPASAVMFLPSILTSSTMPWYSWVMIGLGLAGLGTGFAVVLRFGRGRPKVGRLRAVLTGLASVPFLGWMVGPFLLDLPLPLLLVNWAAIALGAGTLLGASTFIRRRTPRLPEPLRELPGESLEQWFARVEREAEVRHRYRCVRSAPAGCRWRFEIAPAPA